MQWNKLAFGFMGSAFWHPFLPVKCWCHFLRPWTAPLPWSLAACEISLARKSWRTKRLQCSHVRNFVATKIWFLLLHHFARPAFDQCAASHAVQTANSEELTPLLQQLSDMPLHTSIGIACPLPPRGVSLRFYSEKSWAIFSKKLPRTEQASHSTEEKSWPCIPKFLVTM